MTNTNILHDDIPMVDIPLNPPPPPRDQLTTSSIPKPTGKYDVDVLCKVLPSLIKWRLFVFYAPFFTGKDFEPSALADVHPHASASTDPTTSSPKANNVNDHQSSRYVAHEARNKAYAILDGFVKEELQIDFVELNRRYLSDKKSFQRRNRLIGIKSTAFLPTLKTLVTVSNRLDIPIRQFELALATYSQYVELLQRNLLLCAAHSRSAYERLSASCMADDRQWQTLAQILYEDARDVSTFSIFPRLERDRKGKGDEVLVFRNAVLRCCPRYFADLEVERQRCGCGCSCDNQRGYRLRQEVDQEYDYNEDDRQGSIAVSCFASVFCFFVCARLPHKVLGMHIGSNCVCKKERRIRYRLSRCEEALMDGSFELMQQMTREARRSGKWARGNAQSSWKNGHREQPRGAEPLETITEESEE